MSDSFQHAGVTEDSSLTDFTDAAPESDETDVSAPESDEPVGSDDGSGDSEPDEETTSSAVRASGDAPEGDTRALLSRATYGWGEFRCARCEQVIERGWRDDDATVCTSCKAW